MDRHEEERKRTIARMLAQVERELYGPEPEPLPSPDARTLNDVFASGTHVRVLRVLALLGEHINLSARDIARRAEISHVRALQVVRELAAARVLKGHHAPTHTIYELDKEYPLYTKITALFKREAELEPSVSPPPGGGSSPPPGSGRRT